MPRCVQRALRGSRAALALALMVAALFMARRAAAALPIAAPPGGRVAVSLAGGVSGPLVLSEGTGGLTGEFTVRNVGTEPLVISRIAIRGDEDDIRSPGRVFVRFAEGAATSAVLAPGAAKSAIVTWLPDRDPRVRQAFGHVVVTSADEAAGEVAMGFRAQLPTGLGWIGEHALSLLVLWPLIATLVLVGVSRVARWDDALVGRLTLAIGALELLAALWAFRRFGPDVGRASGNDGYQFVERFVWVRAAGVEWYLGVDGSSMPLVLLAAAVALLGLIVASAEPRMRKGEYYVGAALLSTGVMGVLVALDLALLLAAWQLVWLSLVLLVGGWGGARCQVAAAKLATYATLGSVALLFASVALSRASGSTFLVDGTPALHTFAIPELSRTSFAAKGSMLGLPFADAAWVLLLITVAMATPLVPLHGWLPDVIEQSPAGVGIVVAGAVLTLGPYLLVRVGLGAVPEGARWAGASVAALGAIGAVWGALCAMVQPDLRRFLAYAAISAAAMSLYGIGSLTPEGIAGGGFLVLVHSLSSALLLGVYAAIAQRVGTRAAARFSGLSAQAPLLAGLAGIALGVSAAVPGLAGAWGVLLTMLGGFVRYPILALIVAAVLGVSAAAHLRFARAILFGPSRPDAHGVRDVGLFGARLPDATWWEMVSLAPFAALALLLGLWPVPILSPIVVAARDCSAVVDPTGPDPRVDVP
jgi:NADH-quinone oxidoreductase subunit M